MMVVAATLAASTALAQNEQWLSYHTGTEGRGYRSLDLTTNAPPDVKLPALKAPPYFAKWQTPMDPSGARWVCLDRTRKSGPYDQLYIDRNGNGRLDDEAPVSARLDPYNAYFRGVPVVFKGEDGPISCHLIFRFYQYDKNPARLMASSAGWYEGDVKFDGAKKRIQLIDANVNGAFNDMGSSPSDCDRVQVDLDKSRERFLGRMLEVDGKFFNIEVARDGAFVKLKRAENLAFGPVRVPETISEIAAFGGNGHFVRKPVKGEFTLPSGSYQIYRWSINRKDEKGLPWTMSGEDFPKEFKFLVAAEKPAVLEIGEPVSAVLKITENSTNRVMSFNLDFVGRQKESIRILRGSDYPRGPKLMLANAAGTMCYTNTFEFG
jgi:hypothetical protein